MDQKFEGTPRCEIRLDGRKVVRGDVVNDWGSRLQWAVSLDGKVVATPGARGGYEFEQADAAPGKYEVVLQMWKYESYRNGSIGKYVDVSDKVTFSV